MKAWRNDKWYNKRVLIWHFTLVLININYGKIGGQTGLFYTKNPVFYTSGNRFVRHTGTFGNLWFFHLSHRTTVIQYLLVRCMFSLVPNNRTNVNVEACGVKHHNPNPNTPAMNLIGLLPVFLIDSSSVIQYLNLWKPRGNPGV